MKRKKEKETWRVMSGIGRMNKIKSKEWLTTISYKMVDEVVCVFRVSIIISQSLWNDLISFAPGNLVFHFHNPQCADNSII